MKKLSVRELFQLAKGKETKCCADADQKVAGKETLEKSDESKRSSKNNCCG
jgi:hypothetical protein